VQAMEIARMAEGKGMSLPAYLDLVRELRDLGYAIVDYEDAKTDRRNLILRHDVDMCLRRALSMAEEEARISARAHYFILLDTEMYNIRSKKAQDVLRAIRDLGHELGLHFDPSVVPEGDIDGLQRSVGRDCAALEQILESPVKTVTFHRPAKWLLGYPDELGGRLHGYMPRFFSDMGYCSDSEGRFRFQHPLQHPAVEAGGALQLVIHPIWWVAGVDEGPLDKLGRFLEDRRRTISDELAANCRPYAAASGRTRPNGER